MTIIRLQRASGFVACLHFSTAPLSMESGAAAALSVQFITTSARFRDHHGKLQRRCMFAAIKQMRRQRAEAVNHARRQPQWRCNLRQQPPCTRHAVPACKKQWCGRSCRNSQNNHHHRISTPEYPWGGQWTTTVLTEYDDDRPS